jgi:hypothetical protein
MRDRLIYHEQLFYKSEIGYEPLPWYRRAVSQKDKGITLYQDNTTGECILVYGAEHHWVSLFVFVPNAFIGPLREVEIRGDGTGEQESCLQECFQIRHIVDIDIISPVLELGDHPSAIMRVPVYGEPVDAPP